MKKRVKTNFSRIKKKKKKLTVENWQTTSSETTQWNSTQFVILYTVYTYVHVQLNILNIIGKMYCNANAL